MTIQFETCRREFREPLRELFNAHWRPNYIAMQPKFFDWQFHQNPYIPEDMEDSVLLALDNGQLVGALGLVPTVFHVGNESVNGTWLSNWLSRPDYRNKGLGAMLLSQAMKRFKIVASTALSKFAKPIYKGLGFHYLDMMERMLLVLDAEQVCGLMEESMLPGIKLLEIPKPVSVPYVLTLAFPPEVDEFIERVRPTMAVMPTRARKYLTWRYTQHPSFIYPIIIEWRGGKIEGLAVIRIETVRGRTEKVGRLVEWFASDIGRPGLGAKVLNFLHDQGCGLADFFCTSKLFAAELRNMGFFPAQPGLVVPYLFQPLDYGRRGTNFVAWSSLDSKLAQDFNYWYVTKGDNDQDRPNPTGALAVIAQLSDNGSVSLAQVRKLIDGAHVAVVGNAKSILNSPKDIDGFDVVIRMNRGGTPGISPECLGTRTDVWVLSGCKPIGKERIEELVRPRQVWWMGHTDPAGVKSNTGEIICKHPYLSSIAFMRPDTIHAELRALLDGNWPSTGLVVIYFLTELSPASVTIFGFDWWRSPDRGWQGLGVTRWEEASLSGPNHDPEREEYLVRKLLSRDSRFSLVQDY